MATRMCSGYTQKTKADLISEIENLQDQILDLKGAQTELTQAEVQLQKLSQIVEQNPCLITITDTTGCIEYVNPKFTQVTGYSSEEVLGKNPRILNSGEMPQREYKKLWDTITSGAEWHGEFHNKKKNGELYWELASISPIKNPSGVITHFVAVKEDITQRKQAENELSVSRQELRNLSNYLQDAREKDRKHVAREIHDELGQLLSLLKIDLFWIEKHERESEKPFTEKIQTMEKTIDLAIQTVQKISRELRPSMLDNLGLIPAIEWQTTEFESRTGIKCEVKLQIDEIELSSEVSIATFRVLQETLTNVVRHSEATRVKVILSNKSGEVVLKIKDNGKGITQKQISDHRSFGIIGIKERIRCLNGSVRISGKPGRGSIVQVSIPYESLKGK